MPQHIASTKEMRVWSRQWPIFPWMMKALVIGDSDKPRCWNAQVRITATDNRTE